MGVAIRDTSQIATGVDLGPAVAHMDMLAAIRRVHPGLLEASHDTRMNEPAAVGGSSYR